MRLRVATSTSRDIASEEGTALGKHEKRSVPKAQRTLVGAQAAHNRNTQRLHKRHALWMSAYYWPCRSKIVKSRRKVKPSKPAFLFASMPSGKNTANVSAVEQHSFFQPAQTFLM